MYRLLQKKAQKSEKSRFYLSLMLGVMVCFGIAVIYSVFHQPIHETSHAGKKSTLKSAPLFDLPDDLGKLHSLKDFRGKWVLIHFWATWCPPCIGEIPDWIELREVLKKDAPIQFIAVSLDTRWEDAHRILPQEPKISGLISLLDSSGKVPETYGTFNYPETYLLNPELRIITKWVGPQKWNALETLEFFKKILSQEEPTGSP